MRILVLACMQKATGNAHIALRVQHQLTLGGHQVFLKDSAETHLAEIQQLIAQENIEYAFGLHVLFAGPLLAALDLPYTLIFGGTDLYEPMHALYQQQMDRVVYHARSYIAFSDENRRQAECKWPKLNGRVQVSHQAVFIPSLLPQFSWSEWGLDADKFTILLPASLRPVKDPQFILQAFGRVSSEQNMQLVIVGDVLDYDYGQLFFEQLAHSPNVHYFPAVEREKLLAMMGDSQVVLNTSRSEGMCGCLLEAMTLGVPVVARANPGNSALVRHAVTGLIFDFPEEAIELMIKIKRDPQWARQLVESAQMQVQCEHTMDQERAIYEKILINFQRAQTRIQESGPA